MALLALLACAPAALAANGDISTYAGNGTAGSWGDGGAATSAAIYSPIGMATATNGDIYVADYTSNEVRKISASGTITTVAGTGVAGSAGDGGAATSAQLNQPGDVAIDGAGNLYISDGGNAKIRKVTPGGTISTFAGTGTYGLSGDGGQATLAQLGTPWGLAFDSSGYLYVADYNHTVRKISPLGTISRVAGTGTAGGSGDGGQATSATLNQPVDIAFDSGGNMYVSEFSGHRVRKITPAGVISRFAGNSVAASSGDGGAATSASIYSPSGVAVDSADNLYIAEYNGAVVRKVTPGGTISRYAGTRTAGYSGDGGAANLAQVTQPSGIGVSAAGNLFITDMGNHRVRRVQGVAAPDEPVVSSTNPTSPAKGPASMNPKIIGTAPGGSTVQLYTDSSCSTPIGSSASASTFGGTGISVSVSADTTTTFWATATINGLTSACSSTSVSFTQDSTAPAAPTITSPAPSPSNSRSPSWSFTGEPGATFQCELKLGTPVFPFGSCTSAKTYDLTGKADGTYTFSVKQTDAAGNNSTNATATYTLDTVAPSAPTVGAPAATSGNAPSWTFSGEAGGTYQCQLIDQGSAVISAWTNCTSPRGYSLSSRPDGVYTLQVKQTDDAGNASAIATSNYTYDTGAPAAPTVTAPVATSGNAPSWTFSGEAGGSYQCQLTDSGNTVISAYASCSSPKGYSLSGRPDGVYTLSVKQTDAAGNTGAVATSAYTYDTVAPGAPSVTAPAATSGISPAWAFSGEFGGSYQCRLDQGATNIAGWTTCSSPKSYSLSGRPDAIYTLSVKQTDAAGNTSNTSTSDYTLDTAAPVAPTISASPSSPGTNPNPAWSFSGEGGATLQCRIERSGAMVIDWATCTSGQTFALGGEVDGDYKLLVRARDAAGNTGPAATSGTYTLDRAAPALPTITTAPGVTGHATNPAWYFSGEAGATLECRLDYGVTEIADWTGCSNSKSYDISGGADGTYTFSIRATDAAGNVSAVRTNDYALDRVAPDPPTVTSAPASPRNSVTPSWSFTTELGATTECKLAGPSYLSDWGSCSASRLYNISAGGDGVYTFSVRATDSAGNLGTAQTSTYTLDRAAPSAPTIDTPPTSPGNDTTPTWAFSSEAGATFECKIARGATVISDWAPSCTSAKTYDLSAQSDGTYTFSVRATDTAGNLGPAQTSNYVLDTTPPAAATISVSPPSPGNDTTPQWSFGGGSGGSGFECRIDRGGTQIFGWGTCTSPHVYDLSSEPDGTYTFQVRALDAAGNRGSAASSAFTLDTSVPATPGIDSAPGATGSTRSVAWGFSGDAGEVFECKLARGSTVLSDWNGCSTPRSYSLTGEPDGTYTFSVRGIAGGGTRGAAVTDDYVLDTDPPAAPSVDSPPPTIGNVRSATWGFSAETNAQVECRLDRDGTQVIGWTGNCTSPYVADLSSQPDGVYTLRLRATDAAGNTGPEGTSNYTLDTDAPAAPVVDAPPPSVANNAQPTFGFTAQAGLTYECRLVGAADWQTCTTPRRYDLNTLPDGHYTFEVRARDSAGNVGPAGSAGYDLDRAPAGVLLGATPGSIGNSRTPAWSFDSETGASFECSLSSGGSTVFDWALCTSPRVYDLTGRTDGAYVFAVRARDRAGNLGSPVTQTYTLDTVVPAKPTLKSTPATPSRDRSPSWSFTAEAGATIECRLQRKGNAVFDWAVCTSPKTYNLRDQDDAIYKLLVRARDAAGNMSPNASDDFELDTTDPSPPAINTAPASTSGDGTPTWKFSSDDGGTQFECSLERGSDTVEKRGPCKSPMTYKVVGLEPGVYTFSVWVTDAAGNTSRARTDQFTVTAAATAGGTGSGSGDAAPGSSPSDPAPGAAPASTDPGAPADDSPGASEDNGKDGKNSKDATSGDAPGSTGTRPGAAGTAGAQGGSGGSGSDGSGGDGDGGGKKRSASGKAFHAVSEALGKAAQVVTKNADKSVFPFSLVLIVVLFLGIQSRIDRSDPKLALAPLTADPDLEFSPPPTEA